jgi:hypothetical protein
VTTMRYLLCAILFSGCSFTDEGDGSGTLSVQATVTYSLEDNESHFDVQVRDRSAAFVTDATVELTEDGGSTFQIPVQNQNQGRYERRETGYFRNLSLRVERNGGADWLEASLEGPGPHSIVTPANGTRLSYDDAREELDVEWATTDGVMASEVILEIWTPPPNPQVLHQEKPEDTGEFTIENGSPQQGGNVIRVSRGTDVKLAGATGVSFYKIFYDVRNDVVLE